MMPGFALRFNDSKQQLPIFTS